MKRFDFPQGATPLHDYSGLKLPWVQFIADLNRAEAENVFLAQKRYLQRAVGNPVDWFVTSELKKIHWTMFHKVWDWAGIFRKTKTNLGVNPEWIANQVSMFAYEVRNWPREQTYSIILEQSAVIHHRLVSIHPFENGNGRFSRLIADRYLKACKYPYPTWPSLDADGALRAQYIQSLKNADKGNFDSLIQLMTAWTLGL